MFVVLANFDTLMTHTQKNKNKNKNNKTTYTKAFIGKKWSKVTKL